MHIGIIRYKNKPIYIDLIANEVECYYFHNKTKQDISIDAVKELLKPIFDKTKEKFLEKDGEYRVYINEGTGYKHFYKDEQQDFIKFFLVNGQNGLDYKEENQHDKQIKFLANGGISILLSVALLSTAFALPANNHEISSKVQAEIAVLDDLASEVEATEFYDYDSLCAAIQTSENLTQADKDILYNEELLRAICNTPMTEDRIISLKNKTENVEIQTFSNQNSELQEDVAGYYNVLTPNVIYVGNEYDTKTKIHEFVHLLQDNNEFYYIREACAEMIVYEYYNNENDYYMQITSYNEEVQRIQKLMEIIGSEAIWQVNFSGNSELLTSILSKNLSAEDYNKLYNILTSSPNNQTLVMRKQLNKSFDDILEKLYWNMNHKSIEEDEAINYIDRSYQETSDVRMYKLYFNDSKEYEERPDFVYRETMSAKEAVDQGLAEIKGYTINAIEISEEAYNNGILTDEKDNYQKKYILYQMEKRYDSQQDAEFYKLGDKEYTEQEIEENEEELISKGYITVRYVYYGKILTDYNNYNDEIYSGMELEITQKSSDGYIEQTASEENENGNKTAMVDYYQNIYIDRQVKTTTDTKTR